jgi:hypothetical protein
MDLCDRPRAHRVCPAATSRPILTQVAITDAPFSRVGTETEQPIGDCGGTNSLRPLTVHNRKDPHKILKLMHGSNALFTTVVIPL